MSSVNTASTTSDSAEPTSGAGVGAVSVACSEAFITAWSVQPSGESDGAVPSTSLGAVSPAERWGWLGPACGLGWMAACSECAAEVGATDAARTQAGAPTSASTRLWPQEGSFAGAALDLVNSCSAELVLDGGPGGSDAAGALARDINRRLAGSEPGSDTQPSVSFCARVSTLWVIICRSMLARSREIWKLARSRERRR
eukprot:scaffold52742_cov59-Phaeocystis_antarctica.AAC.1